MAENDLESDLAAVINRHGLDSSANTPDFVLARYLVRQLDNYRESTDEREQWFGVKLRPGMVKPNDNASNQSAMGSQS